MEKRPPPPQMAKRVSRRKFEKPPPLYQVPPRTVPDFLPDASASWETTESMWDHLIKQISCAFR